MPNVTSPGHIKMTVSGDTTKMMVIPETYTQVDITDFAPRAIAGTPAYSTLGLYLDVGQDSFRHGFGQWEQSEPEMYSYSGNHIDTRHGWVQLFTNESTVRTVSGFAWYINDLLEYNGAIIIADNNGIAALKPSDGTYTNSGLAELYNICSNGKYIFVSHSGQMELMWVGQPDTITATKLTFTTPNPAFEDTNQWADNGYVWVFDGTNAGFVHAITASDANSVTVPGWSGKTPDTTSWVLLNADAGNDTNVPDDFQKIVVFGGYLWSYEEDTNYLHYWAETNGSDAEGDGTSDANVITVGPTGGKIVNLIPFNNQLLVMREDGIWAVNEQDTDALAYHSIAFDTEAHEDNFDVAVNWQGFLVYSVRNRLYKYKSGNQDITPPVFNELPPFKQFGGFRGGIVRGKFLYVLGKSNSAYTDEAAPETTTGYVSLLATDGIGWHKLLTLDEEDPIKYDMWLNPTNDNLYLFAQDASNHSKLWKVDLQTYSDIPAVSYPTTGDHNLYTSYYNLGMERINKHFASLTLHGELTANQKVDVSYRIDDATAWTVLGTAFTSDMQEVSFPTATTGKRIQFKLDLSTTSSTATPVVRGLILKVMLRPDVKWGVRCDVMLGDYLHDQRRLMLGKTASQILTALETARDNVAPFDFVDLFGTSRTAYLASMAVEPIMYEDSNVIESVARCTFVFV